MYQPPPTFSAVRESAIDRFERKTPSHVGVPPLVQKVGRPYRRRTYRLEFQGLISLVPILQDKLQYFISTRAIYSDHASVNKLDAAFDDIYFLYNNLSVDIRTLLLKT